MSPVVIKPRVSQELGVFPGSGGNSEDRFSLRQGFHAWLQVLINPEPFFTQEEGATGFKSPCSVLLAYMLILGLACSYMALAGEITGGQINVVFLVVVFVTVLVDMLVYALLLGAWSLLLHWVSRLCGSKNTYAGTFRTATYAFAPCITLSILAALLTLVLYPGQSFRSMQSNPCVLTANLVSLVWMALLTIIGLRTMQRMTYSGAIGAVLVSCILLGVVGGALAVAGMGIGSLTGR